MSLLQKFQEFVARSARDEKQSELFFCPEERRAAMKSPAETLISSKFACCAKNILFFIPTLPHHFGYFIDWVHNFPLRRGRKVLCPPLCILIISTSISGFPSRFMSFLILVLCLFAHLRLVSCRRTN